MARARKCDRCGMCFDPLEYNHQEMIRFQNPYFETGETLKLHRVTRWLVDTSDRSGEDRDKLDFCPNCTRRFIDFMDKDPEFDNPDEEDEANESEFENTIYHLENALDDAYAVNKQLRDSNMALKKELTEALHDCEVLKKERKLLLEKNEELKNHVFLYTGEDLYPYEKTTMDLNKNEEDSQK